ncbi:MAG: hypothetical protein NW223_14225 [Hyphomicrobiaceae bacterium]|nr:hypothetical protein [Hyphomicrobiaceae bacterium]
MLAVLRFLAGVFLLVAAFAGIADATHSAAGKGLVMTSLLEHWSRMAPQTLVAAQASLRRVPLAWDVVVKPALSIPAWMFFIVLAGLFAWGGRRRSRVNIFAN